MKVNVTPKHLLAIASSFAVLGIALLAVGIFLGAAVTKQFTPTTPLQLLAAAATSSENISMATAQVDQSLEALYVLDHLNGNLQCWVLNPRSSKVGAIFKTNVIEAMPGVTLGDLDWSLTTGVINFQQRGNQPPASSLAYVAEGKSGVVAGFGFTFDKALLQQGVLQEGELTVVFKAPIRELQLREQ